MGQPPIARSIPSPVLGTPEVSVKKDFTDLKPWRVGMWAFRDLLRVDTGRSGHLALTQSYYIPFISAARAAGTYSSSPSSPPTTVPAHDGHQKPVLGAGLGPSDRADRTAGRSLNPFGGGMKRAETQDNREPSWVNTEVEDGQKVDRAQSILPPAQRVNFIPPITVSPDISTLNPAHNGRVCSTWGDFHYKTFDGDIFRFPGLCNYVLASHCRAAYEDFNVQVRRELMGTRPTISRIVLKVEGLVLEIANGSMLVNGQREELPYSRAGLLVEHSSSYIKISVRMVLTFFWNGGDSALLELDPKYANQTCGLCGDFNGLPVANEFYVHNVRLTALQFGNLQKLDGPTEQCQDPLPTPATNCTDIGDTCRRTLLGPAFAQCNELVDPEPYVTSCAQDLCRCPSCPCATFAEYSRQCAHAGGRPQNWRGPDLCPQTCPAGMQHQECGSPCTDTCSNPERAQLCDDHCEDGCFCPPGTVLDDVTHSGCVPLKQCPCTYRGRTYAPGAAFTTTCSSCTCSGGRWQCEDLPCPGTCSIQGGSHISTYDEKLYDLHGDCSYILSKRCDDSTFTVLAELRRCGLTDTESCLKSVTLSLHGGDMTIRIQANGAVFMNSIYTQLPTSAANITAFKPSSFFVLVQTGFGLQLQVQLVPLMQVYIRLDPTHRGQMCGLCGNFNQNQADDFTALSGVVEGTGSAFANTWKTQAACPNSKNIFEDPCSLSVENEKYAQHWCSMLTNPTGAFAPCHSIVSPASFHSNCMFDTCNCEKSEDCLCAALSAYVRACAAKGVLLNGWREGVCAKYMSSCPKSQSYEYVVDTCQPTCRSLSEVDVTCGISFVPVDGCTCPVGTYLDDAGTCVPAQECPCYLRGTVVAPGEVVHDNGVVCSCSSGKLSCLGALVQSSTGCTPPMVYVNCSNASAGALGAECLRSCHTLDVDCYSTHCVSGCVCPPGLVSDGNGGCIAQEDCPCVHNEATYQPGDTISVDCNTCTCKNRRWECTSQPCLGTCVAYGDGHFITFDGGRYNFEGDCKYMLAQDYCAGNATNNGNFRIVTENIPCGTTGVTCSKAIKIFLESYELILTEGHMKVVERGPSGDLPYKIRYMGIYLVIEARSGLIVSWDRKTSIFIRLHPSYQGKVCGLCGNFDGNAINDFTTRSQSVVGDVLEFGNSWKFSPTCPDALAPRDPCTANPYRKSWAQKQCSILHSATFAACQSQVDSTKYYEACVSDACACDSGGDCECFCTAVAAYAQACHDAGVCVSWRSPEVCPLFCDYYNPHGECEWHYQPCGAPCMRTCRNPSGRCLHNLPGLEGCYPKCPPSKPFFSEDEMKCVAQCGCYDVDGNYHEVNAKVATAENCQSCTCTSSGIQCEHSLEACTCTYEGKTFGYKDVVYNTTDGLGACLVAICGDNGTIHRNVVDCPGTSPTTPFIFSSTATPPSTAAPQPPISTMCVREVCIWSDWYDSNHPEPGMEGGDFETLQDLRQRGYQVCGLPADIECRAASFPKASLEELGQRVDCDRAHGLTCLNREQSPPLCHNYELRIQCCVLEPCGPSTSLHTSPSPFSSVTTQPTATTETPVSIPKTETTPPKYLPTTTQIIYTRETTLQSTPNSKSTAALTLQTQLTSATMTMSQSVRSSESPGTTACQPKCQWTGWFDEDYPKSEEAGGDIESYDKIRRAGGDICEQPQDIECQAENFPNSTLQQVGQTVHCDASFGLVCRNDEQKGAFRMCYNYRIRLLCCSQNHCEEHTSPLASTTQRPFPSAGPTSQSSSSHTHFMSTPGSTGTEVPTPPLETSTHPGSTSVPPTHTTLNTSQMPTSVSPARTSPTVPPITGTSPGAPSTTSKETQLTKTTGTIIQGTTSCQPRCEWTEWFDVDFPTSGVSGGDIETFDNIRAAGGKMCRVPEKIECRAENYPEVSLDQIGQVLSCSLQEGLVCRNEDQQGRFNMCFNYNVRVLCCDDYRHCGTTAGSTSTRTSTITMTGSVTTTTRASVPPVHTSTSNTLTQVPQTSTPTSSKPTAHSLRSSGVPSTSATTHMPHISSSTAEVVTIQTSSQPTPRSPTTAAKSSSSSLASTPVLTTTPLVPTLGSRPTSGRTISSGFPTRSPTVTTMVTSTGTVCEPRCTWTDWFDESYPVPGLSGGDFETYDNIRAAGNAFCQVPVDIQCRSELQPDTPLRELDQVVHSILSTTNTQGKSTVCEPRCTWTDWFDESYPMPGLSGGDFETYDNIRAAGNAFCQVPVDIQCRSELQPDTPLRELDQVVQCNVSFGLICRNREQTGRFQICHNYHVRVLCCDYTQCPSTPAPTRPFGLETSSSPTSTPPFSSTTLPLSSISPSAARTTATSVPTRCQPACRWTDWLDSDQPQPGRYGGDIETYYHIMDAGERLCDRPAAIECEAKLYPGVSLGALGQVVLCSVQFGLICRNHKQTQAQTCLNYHVRVYCCDDYSHCGTTKGPMSTRASTHTPETLMSTSKISTSVHTPTSSTAVPTPTSNTLTQVPQTSTPTSSKPTAHALRSSGVPSTSATTHTPHISPSTAEVVTIQTSSQPTPRSPTTAAKSPSSSLASTPVLTTTPLVPTLGSRPTSGRTISSEFPTRSPTVTTMVTSTGTVCEPRCTWTDWFDESYPVPGLSGGDFETYDNIRYCHNYHIRFLCCEDRSHCPSTPATTGMTPTTTGETTRTSRMITLTKATSMGTPLSPTSVTTSSLVPSSGIASTVTLPTTISESRSSGLSSSLPTWLPTASLATSSSPVHTPLLPTSSSSLTTSRCYCQAFGELFLPGEVIYNKTDKAGCHFYAICNQQCNIDRFQDTCPTTLPPASSVAPSSIPVTMSTPPPSPAPGCDHAIPPRQVNETWTLADCTVARCEGDNRIVLLEPKPVANVTCANQYQPVKVQNQSDPCDYHYECECICTSWGDSYSTFDGTVFTFADNCTYVLLREIHPQHGNLSVLMDHQYCAADAVDASFCPPAILIYYLSMEVVLTVTDLGEGKMQSLILFDGKHVSSGFSKNGVSVSETASGTMGVHIPAIGAYIIFDGSIFQAQLSYSHFSHNTEGQCGTCTNSQVDDCRRPDGTIAPTCKDMARHWLVPDVSKEGCRPPTSPPPSMSTPSTVSSSSTSLTASTPSTEPTPCLPSPLCELILSPIFEECHNLVPPSYFFMACVSDSCQGDGSQLLCESLEAYAAVCRNWGACSNWRNATNGLCDFSCPPTKVYKPCGPVQPESCDSRIQSPISPGLAEGCFCPDGEILFNVHTGVCVPECPCVGPDGFPKFPGEQWVSNCQSCVCEDRPATVHCRPVQCELLDEPQECGRPGFVNVTRPRADNPCCPETLCVCNATTCPQDPPECGPGLELIRTQEEDACCPTFSCRPQLCNYNGTAYGIGAIFPGVVPCHTCTCMSRDTQPPTVECEEDVCDTTCPKGFEYRKTAGQCCGDCVQITCLTPDEQPVQPNDTWVNHRLDNCTEYRCEATDGNFMLVPQPVPCPDVTACRGVLRKRGCCYYCEEVDKCQVQANTTVLRHLDCVTDSAVSINFCEGSCPGFSKYSAEAQTMERHCACCQETKTHEEEVMLLCPDGTRIRHSYTQVDECGCGPACLPSAPSDTFLT
ncbi:PREDICTED: mucin-5B [Chrysochloris asiatica]|uniref:Mucin-5B n=1 Tax=Chrysochloris asiatica TaxID=185453 RepID=A0A9B0T8S7_CHRAS|nr:PREDICTED: mucin-5B [Chrysochloris asiatica]